MTTCPPSLKRLLSSSKSGLCLIATGLALTLGSGGLQAATFTWISDGTSTGGSGWLNKDNWQNNVAIAQDSDLVFPAGTSPVSVNDRANVRIQSITFQTGAAPFTLSGDRIISSGSEIYNAGSNTHTFDLGITFRNATGAINTGTNGGNFVFNGKLERTDVSGNPVSGYVTLNLTGTGMVTVTNTSNERIHWSVLAGTLKAAPGALSGGNVTLKRSGSNGATLLLEGGSAHTVSSLTVGASSTISGTAALVVSGAFGGDANNDLIKTVFFTNTAGATLNDINLNPSNRGGGMSISTVTSDVKVEVNGTIRNSETDGPGENEKLTKSGAGVLVVRGANTWSGGTTVSAGTMLVENTTGSGLGSGAVEVLAGARLGGHGIIELGDGETVSVENGGTLAPGAAGLALATLQLSGVNHTSSALLDMEAGSAFNFRFGAGDLSDGVAFSSYHSGGLALDIGGITVHGTDVQAGSFTLFTFDSITETELELLQGRLVLGSGFENYDASFVTQFQGEGGSIGLAVIPEPGASLLGLIGFVTAAGIFRRRRKSARKGEAVQEAVKK
ncbi:MAG TPA: autotransporter-associated beta strand repeat-containing protein [Chthoniobacteraceae bacterium]|nr:autotransporter-associated beta strand repeat-containing protein [Chthoniobacteraceae bacterium]